MPNAFNFSASPFDSLTNQEQALVRARVDIAYFREGDIILDVGAAPEHLYVLIKGRVAQLDGEEMLHSYGPDDTFDGRGLVAGRTSHRFVAQEEVLAYQLARDAVSSLIASNATFSALLFSSLGDKLSALSQRHNQHEMRSLTLSRLEDALHGTPHYVDAATDIVTVAQVFERERTSHVLVRDESSTPPKLGIFSATTLTRAILDGTPLERLPVGKFAAFNLITLAPDALMGDALTTMLRHRIHRVVVADSNGVYGVVESLDIFSFLSNHSHLIITRIDQASDLDALAEAAKQTPRMVQQLLASGTDTGLMSALVQEVNARLFERTWALIAPQNLRENSCLIVMGSEGRGEQLLKTDQDNALILRDGFVQPDDLPALCEAFSQALTRFGYPECQGKIMVNNPAWRGSVQNWRERTRGWLLGGTPENLMNLAIFLDAHAVCGDSTLLDDVRTALWQLATDHAATLSRFAAAIDAFGGGGGGWWNRMFALGEGDELLYLKKEGIFPIVHGIRSLALERRILSTRTVERIESLVREGIFQRKQGDELAHALRFFIRLRLKAGLAELEAGRPVSGLVDVKKLSTLERDLLKDALTIVKRFKVMLRHRYRLDVL